MFRLLLQTTAVLALALPATAQDAEVGEEYEITIETEEENQYVGMYGQARIGSVVVNIPNASRLLKNTRIGLFSWPSCVSRPPRQRCARGHAVPTRGPATPAAGDQGHLASRFRNRTKL